MSSSIGRYRIVERIAVGGMGEVYRANAEAVSGVSKEVALKLLLPELATRAELAALFVEEMKVALTLSHANVVQTFDVGRIDDRYFLAMELVDGTTLADLIAHDGRGAAIDDRHAVTIAVEALKGLDYAHRRAAPDGQPLGLVHRDVSPSNVLVSREGEVKVADFGIAKSRLRSFDSMAGTIAGKIEYMAPEQLRGEAVDRRADVWSMGVVLFEMLSGERPFVGGYPDIVPLVVEGRRPTLLEKRPDVPERLARAVERALRVERDERFPNAATMRQELEELAMARGWMLSVTDLAELVEDTRARDPRGTSRRAATTGWSDGRSAAAGDPTSRRDESTGIEVPIAPCEGADPFDAILGRQLERLEVTDGFSVYRTASGLAVSATPKMPSERLQPTLSATPKVPSERLHLEVEHARPPVRPAPPRRRGLGTNAAVAFGVLTAAFVVVGVWWSNRPSQPTPLARSAAPASSSTAVPTDALAAAPSAARAPPPLDAPASGFGASSSFALGASGQSVGEATDAGLAAARALGEGPAKRRAGDERRASRENRVESRAAPDTAASPAPAEPAMLSVNTDPWSNVYVNGRLIRATPLLRHRLAPGRHRVVVRNPGLGLERSMSVELAPGEHRRITFDLR